MGATVRVEVVGTTTVITIDRPAVRNAVDGPTARSLHQAFLDFDADDDRSVAILTGAAGTFCAGAGACRSSTAAPSACPAWSGRAAPWT